MDIERFIKDRKWIFAKTYAKTAPHEYTVLDDLERPENFVKFQDFARKIEADGYSEAFGGRTYKYLRVGQYKYWVMDPIGSVRLISSPQKITNVIS